MADTWVLTHGGRAIRCLRCGLTSHGPDDVKNLFCGKCGFHEQARLRIRVVDIEIEGSDEAVREGIRQLTDAMDAAPEVPLIDGVATFPPRPPR